MTERAPLALIAAVAKNRVIGKDNDIPWRYPEDWQHFKRTTLGHAIIMGRGTYDSMGKPLKGRRNIVVSRQPGLVLAGCEVVSSLDAAIALARETDACPFIVGGSALYAAALPRVTRLFLTEIPDEVEGDTFFPEFDRAEFRETERRESGGLVYLTLDRV